MPELEDIRTFSEVVESGSLTRAGARLGMSKSMVSRRLARLEAELGTPLLARTTRGLSLTEAGSDFRPYAERMLAELQSARDAMSRQGEVSGRLRLTAPVSFGSTHLGAGAGGAGGPASAAGDQLLVTATGSSTWSARGSTPRCGSAARRFDADRAADRAGAGGDGGEPGVSGAARHAADAGGVSREHDAIPHGDAVWQFRKDGRRFSHRPRGRFTADSGPVELAGVVAGLGIAAMPAFLAGAALRRGAVSSCCRTMRSPRPGSTSSGRRRPSRCR